MRHGKARILVVTTLLALGALAAATPTAAGPAAPAARPAATTVTLYPSADAYVNEALPATNYDNASEWPVARNASNQERYPLLKFDLSGIPEGSQIDSAELRLWLEGTPLGPPFVAIGVARVAIAWNQATVTWNSRPPDQCCWATLDVGQPASDYQIWPMRTLVTNWVSGNFVNHGLALHGPASGEYTRLFAASGGRRPRLVVAYVPPTPTVTPTPSATASALPTVTPTPSATASVTPSATASATATRTPTATPSQTATPSPSPSATALPTQTATPTLTASASPSASPSGTASPASPTPSPSVTATAGDTVTPTAGAPATATPTGTGTVPPSSTPGPSPSATDTPIVAPTASATAGASATSVPAETPTPGAAGRIEGRVWQDGDRDGIEDPGELGLPGVWLDLTRPGGATAAATDGEGRFVFAAPTGGDYRLDVAEASLPAGFVLVSGREPWTGQAGPGVVVTLGFGYAPLAVVGRVFLPWLER